MEALQSSILIANSLLMVFLLIEIAFLLHCLRRLEIRLDVNNYSVTMKNNNITPTAPRQSGNLIRRSPVHIDDETAYMIEKKNKRQQNPVL